MAEAAKDRSFVPVRIAVLTVSDTRTPDTDKSGTVLAERISDAGHSVSDHKIVKDDVRAMPDLDVLVPAGVADVRGDRPVIVPSIQKHKVN